MSRIRRPLLLALLTLVALIAVGCVAEDFPQSTLAPKSDFTRLIDDLFQFIVLLAVIVWVVVTGVLVYALVRFRSRPGDQLPTQVHGHTRLEIGWTILPVLIFAAIAVPTVEAIFRVDTIPSTASMRVNVVGKQWWWEFQYQGLNIVTANELHVPVGETVGLELQSDNVIHSFWIPRLAAKRDMIPGRAGPSGQFNILWFTAEQPGEYIGQCAEFCGTSHANMRAKVIVHSKADFDAWVRKQQAPAPAPTTPETQRGMQLVTQGACIGCHTINGTAAQGKVGPNLTDFGNHTTVATIKENNAENLKAWIRNPQEFKPGALMPNLGLPEEDLNAITAYLLSLK